MTKNGCPNIDPCSKPAPIDSQLEGWPFKAILSHDLWRNDPVN